MMGMKCDEIPALYRGFKGALIINYLRLYVVDAVETLKQYNNIGMAGKYAAKRLVHGKCVCSLWLPLCLLLML